MDYAGFISYSHQADQLLARAIENGLKRFAKPWYRRQALAIFRDQTDLAASPQLWTSIQDALDRSSNLIFLANPLSAASTWTNSELQHWLSTKSANKIILVLTDGTLTWNKETHSFDLASSTALPNCLVSAFSEEPLYVDARWARELRTFSLRDPQWLDLIANLAAPLHGKPKADLASAEVREHKRTLATAWAAAISLALLAVATTLFAISAETQRSIATSKKELAERTLARSDLARALDMIEQDDAGKATTYLARSMLLEPTRLPSTMRLASLLLQRSFPRVSGQGPTFSGPVISLEYSPDGRFLAAASDWELVVWDVNAGKALFDGFKHNLKTTHLEFSQDGNWLALSSAYGGMMMGGTHGELHVWNLQTPHQPPRVIPVDGKLWTVKFLPDTNVPTIVTASSSAIEFWNLISREPAPSRFDLDTLKKHVDQLSLTNNSFSDVALTGVNGDLIVVAGVLTPAVIARINAKTKQVENARRLSMTPGKIALSKDGATVLLTFPNNYLEQFSLGSSPREGIALVLDSKTLQPIGDPMNSNDLFADIKFLPHGQSIFSGAEDGSLSLWIAPAGTLLDFRGRHRDAVSSVDVSPDGFLLGSGSKDGTARVWSAFAPSNHSEDLVHSSAVTALRFHPSASRLATATESGEVFFWEVPPRGALPMRLRGQGSIRAAVLGLDGQRLITHSTNGVLQILDLRSARLLRQLDAPGNAEFYLLKGNATLLVQNERRFRLIRLTDTADVTDWVDLRSDINQISFDTKGDRFLTATDSGAVEIWAAASGKREGQSLQHEGPVRSAVFTPDGNILSTAEQSIILWDADKAIQSKRVDAITPSKNWSLKEGGLTHFAISVVDLRLLANGNFLAIYGEESDVLDVERIRNRYSAEQAEVWSLDSLQKLAVLHAGTDDLTTVGTSTNGRLVALGSRDGVVRVWSGVNGTAVSEPLRHSFPIRSLIFTGEDTRLVVDGKYDRVFVWQGWAADARPLILRLDGQAQHVKALPKAGGLVTLSTTHKIVVWDETTGERVIDPVVVPGKSDLLIADSLGEKLGASDNSSIWVWSFPLPKTQLERCALARTAEQSSGYRLNSDDIPAPIAILTSQSAFDSALCANLAEDQSDPIGDWLLLPASGQNTAPDTSILRHALLEEALARGDNDQFLLSLVLTDPSDPCLRMAIGGKLAKLPGESSYSRMGEFFIEHAKSKIAGRVCP